MFDMFCDLYTRYPIVALGLPAAYQAECVARAKVSCIQFCDLCTTFSRAKKWHLSYLESNAPSGAANHRIFNSLFRVFIVVRVRRINVFVTKDHKNCHM